MFSSYICPCRDDKVRRNMGSAPIALADRWVKAAEKMVATPSDYKAFSKLLTQLILSCGKDDIPVVAMDAL